MNFIIYPDNKYVCDASDSLLLVVDSQERLVDAMHESERQNLINNISILVKSASLLNVPTIVTEQYPSGLGKTVGQITESLNSNVQPMEKTCFSCLGLSELKQKLSNLRKKQVILCGIETHVCILQTACDLISIDIDVFLVEDATTSRKLFNKNNAIARLRQIGVSISNTESVLFELLKDAKHQHFKQVSSLIK